MSADVRALIDRIATALGPEATPERVERVARAVLDARAPTAPARAPALAPRSPDGPATGATRVVVTAYGQDQPGVLAAITAELSASGANILDVSQKVLQGYFTVVLVADLSEGTDLGAVRDVLTSRGEAMGARVLLQHEELFQAMHRP
ncbi:ACT domain-containing protein [Rubrivirga sp. SAORIC476]|uniref:ACT domain-containing protein n=1 Tax=Rubrivirga sp. SAORIC476 TaxID=1961794 RepID=UPI000BA98EFC|nr:ACT domain-containing protein [Rubrivirga sp. SAORIC476]